MAALTGHSMTTPVAQLASAAGVGRLVLVHIDPLEGENGPGKLEAARAIFPKTLVGFDRMEIDF